MAALLKEKPSAKVIILSMHDDKPTVEQALRLGAKGYLVKETAAEEIAKALRAVYGGGTFFSLPLEGIAAAATGRRGKKPAASSPLTAKETEIAALFGSGLGKEQVAARLGLSRHTVHAHKSNIFSKLGIHKQTDLVRYAIKKGLVRP